MASLTDRMRREVAENVYRDSLLNWVRKNSCGAVMPRRRKKEN